MGTVPIPVLVRRRLQPIPPPLRRAPSPSSTSRNGRSGRSSNGGPLQLLP
ncbi:hypothetical protein HanIR_Chr16g0803051 [Helianthus annuus]|nr:hypothetical protein HanIR_Chr16g0803051 [Helianthus annuus]